MEGWRHNKLCIKKDKNGCGCGQVNEFSAQKCVECMRKLTDYKVVCAACFYERYDCNCFACEKHEYLDAEDECSECEKQE